MIEGFYTAVSTMAAKMAKQQIIGNNLANLNTVGFKQDIPQAQQFDNLLLFALRRNSGVGPIDNADAFVGKTGGGLELLPSALDLTDGPVTQTNRPLDLAIIGRGFFRLRGNDGAETFMRAVAFDRDVDGTLVNRLGEAVLDVNGAPISLADGTIRVLTNGQMLLDGQAVAQLAIFDLPDGSDWKKAGNAHFRPANSTDVPEQIVTPNMLQGFLEQSNVDTEFQMAEMLSAFRVYETAQSLIQMEDETIAQAIREVGRVQ